MRSRCRITVSNRGRQVSIDAIIDTGNLLCEPFSGLPVIVAEMDALESVLPEGLENFPEQPASGIRVIPYCGVGGEGIMPAFRPEKLTAVLPGSRPRSADAYIGVLRKGRVGKDHHAIVNPDILL